MTIVESTPEALVVEATYGPGGKPPPKHLHPSQDERFRMLAGTLRFRVGGDDRDARGGRGDRVPTGVAHQVWNPHDEPATVDLDHGAGGRTEEWFRAVDAPTAGRERARRRACSASPRLLDEYRDTFRLAVGPGPAGRRRRSRRSAPSAACAATGEVAQGHRLRR